MSDIRREGQDARPGYPCSDFVLDSLPLGIIFQNTQGVITAANPAAERILGLSLDQMRGLRSIDPRWRAIHEDGSPFPGVEHPAMVALRTGEPVRNVIMGVINPHRDAPAWIKISAVPIRNSTEERLEGVYVCFEDISAQKEAQRQEAASEARFQALFTAMSEGMAQHRLIRDAAGHPCDYRILDVNSAFTEQTGLTRERVVGQLGSTAYGTDSAPFLERYAQVVETGQPQVFEQYFPPLQRHFQISAFSPEPGHFATIFEDITERKLAEEALRESEARYRAMVEGQDDAVCRWLPDGTLTFVNSAYRALFASAGEDLLGRRWFDLIPEADRAGVVANCRDLIARPRILRYEHPSLASDGAIRWIQWVDVPLFDADGRCREFQSVGRDVTERKQAEQALLKAYELQNALLDQAPALVWRSDTEAKCVWFNATWLNFTGRTLQQEYGDGWAEGVHPEDLEDCVATYLDAFRERHPFEMEYRLRHHDGAYRWILDCGIPLHSSDGSFSGYIGYCFDITERKRTAIELERHRHHLEDLVAERTAELETANRQLLVSDRRLKAVFELSQQAESLEEQGLLERGIEEAVRLSGSEIGYLHFIDEEQETIQLHVWSSGALRHCGVEHLDHYPIAAAGVWADTLRLRRPLVHNDYREMAERRGQPPGHPVLIRHLSVPVIDGGRVRLLIGVGNKPADYDDADMRELQLMADDLWRVVMRRRAKAALTAAKDAAEQANRAKSDFLANMSHEIRTPLNAVLGMAHLIRHDGVTPAQANRLDKIEIAGRHLLDIINAILDLSKIESGKLILERAEVRVSTIVRNLLAILSDKIEAKGLMFRVELPRLPPDLIGDPARIQQALLNYATNAIKFTETGSITLRTRLEADFGDEFILRFEVEDSGIGIAPEQLPRLFTAFEQADHSITRRYGGTGLGLALTKRLAQSMGGEAGVDSRLGVGSTFWFTVRLQRGDPARVEPETSRPAGDRIDPALDGRTRRLLLVEDEPINREVALDLLADLGLAIDTAENGAEAVERARQNPYDIILMDMQMPVLDGLEATRRIRQLPQTAQVPIVAMTANAFAEDRARCLEAGMDDFLTKPVEPAKLLDVLQHWLDRS